VDSLPTQTGQSGKYLTTNGTSASWGSITIPTVNNATLTIQKNGTSVATFTANSSTNTTANISVPTQASDISALDTNVSNATSTGKKTIAELAMPSSSIENLTLLASGNTYTATGSGVICLNKVASAAGQYISIKNNTTDVEDVSIAVAAYNALVVSVPVAKDDVVVINYNVAGVTNSFTFTKAKGEV
jgi:hypothetical protein